MIDASIVNDYLNGNSLMSLERKYHISTYILKKELRALGVHIRSRNEQNKFSPQNQRQYKVNDCFFSQQNETMAYLLGFIAADGCVYAKDNTIKIALSSVDDSFLEDIRIIMGVENPVNHYETKDGFLVSELRFRSYQMKQDLAAYNIVPRKTYSFTFPQKLKPEYYKDFIRGYFDGDGSVSTAGANAIRWQLCSHEKDVLIHVVDFFYNNGIDKVNIQKVKDKDLYYIQYSTRATKKIYNILYSDNCLCLPRKREKYQSLLK